MIKLLADRVLVDRESTDNVKKIGNIELSLLSQADDSVAFTGTVVAVGDGKRTQTGELIVPTVKVGDAVMYRTFGRSELMVDGKKYELILESDIIAII